MSVVRMRMGLYVVDVTTDKVRNMSWFLCADFSAVYSISSRHGEFIVIVFIVRIASLWVCTVVVYGDVFGQEEGVVIKIMDGARKCLVQRVPGVELKRGVLVRVFRQIVFA